MKNNDYTNRLLADPKGSYKKWFQLETEFLKENVSSNSKVLDVGCGDGRSVSDLLSITEHIVGLDHDNVAIERAKLKLRDHPQIMFVEAEATNIPFPDNSFDSIICMFSFGNFADNKITALNEMKRVLHPGGKLIISTYSENSFDERMETYKRLNIPIVKTIDERTVVFDPSLGDNISEQFSKAELEDIFEQAGFSVLKILNVGIAYISLLLK